MLAAVSRRRAHHIIAQSNPASAARLRSDLLDVVTLLEAWLVPRQIRSTREARGCYEPDAGRRLPATAQELVVIFRLSSSDRYWPL